MSSRWPTDLDDNGTAPPNLMLVASGDEQLMRQGMYQLQAATQLQDRGFKIESFQTPVAGKIIRITIPIVAAAADGTKHAIYTQCEHWTSERIEDLRTWIANLREEADLAVIVASRLPLPDPASAPEVSQWLHLPYDTLTTPDPPPATTTEEPVLPCLKEAKWVGRGDSVCRALWEKQSSNFMPWVAIGYDRPHTFEFISTKSLAELKTTEDALHARALVALRARPAKWQPVELDVEGTPLKMLVCTGDYFSAEHILDPEFMKEAQRILKAPGLLVGVPRRGFLMATVVGEKDHRLLLAFGAGVAGQYSRGESALISPMLFAMKDGRIVAIIEDIADAIVPDGEPKGAPTGAPGDEDDEDEEEGDPGEPYVSAMVTRNDRGTEDVHLMAGGPDGDRLAKAIELGFQGLMKEHARRKEFSGHIQIVVLGNTPVAERKNIPSLLEHLRGICNDLSKGNDKRYRVSLTYQKDSLSAAAASPSPAPTTRPAAPRPTTTRPTSTERPRAATSSTSRASVPPPQSGPSFLTRFKWRLAGAIAAAAVAWAIYGRGGGVSYPASVTYGGDALPQATKWERGGLSGAVYVPEGERLPAASRQVGIIVSSQHDSGAGLLQWIQQQQAAQSTAQIHHDAVADGERCHVGIAFLNDFVRPYLSLQSCRTLGSGAACIELDDELDNGIVASCLNRPGCFVEVCEERWQTERSTLTRALTAVVGQ